MTEKSEFPQTWIFLRGLTRSSFHWFGFEKKFKTHFACQNTISPDLAGNGIFFADRSPTEIDQAVNQLRRQCGLISDQKIGLFSISMGAMIATRWAELYPSEVSHLVLVNASFSAFSSFYQRLLPANYFQIFKNFLFSNPQQIEKFILKTTSNFEEKWRPHLAESVDYHKSHPLALGNFMRQLKLSGQTSFKIRPRAKTLVLSSLQDHLVSSDCSQAIAENWQLPIETHPTAGHDLPLDDADWILEKINKHFI